MSGIIINPYVFAAGLADINNVYSMEFDGVDDKITTGHTEGGDITLSAWINCDGTYTAWEPRYPISITPSHVGLPNATLGRFYLRSTDFVVMLQLYDDAGANWTNYYVDIDLAGAGWKHCLWTYNDTTKVVYFYLDGVRQDWTKWGGTPSDVPYLTATGYSYASNLIMGNVTVAASSYFFDGKVDEVAVFDYVLTEEQALEIFNATSAAKTADLSTMATPPTAWYRMGD